MFHFHYFHWINHGKPLVNFEPLVNHDRFTGNPTPLNAMAIPQIRAGFRVAAFVECLVKLALHRLGSKGGDDGGSRDPPFYEACWDEYG
jgi:hypothetical protein